MKKTRENSAVDASLTGRAKPHTDRDSAGFPEGGEGRAPDYTDISAFETVKRVFSENFHRYRANYALAIVCMMLVAFTTAYSAYIIKDVVNEVFEEKNLAAAYSIAALILLIFFVKGIAGFGQDVILNRISNNIIARYQTRAFDKILSLGVSYLSQTRSAFLIGQINANIAGVKNMMNVIMTTFIRDLLTLAGLIFVMVWQDPLLATGSLVMIPIAGYVIARYVKRVKTVSRKNVKVTSQIGASMIETAQGMPVVKAFTMENLLRRNVQNRIDTSEKQANTIALVNARTKPLTETLGGFAIAGAVAFGGWRVISLDGNPGALLSFLAAAMLAYDPARRIASFRVQFEKSVVNARMLYEILDTEPPQRDKPDAKELVVDKGEIEFANVSFSYTDAEVRTLSNVSFVAKAGEITALVGPSGAGKSTIINLLLRFYDVPEGRIIVDGQDIADCKITSLRKSVAFVSQNPVMFEGTVADNIRFGRPDASQEEIIDAATQAQAHDFIMALPEGYDTPVGEMGANFSGGQKQRISIARAILRDAPILLLDEATSALDNESEKLVQKALSELMIGRTTIVIAHRLSTIQDAHQIIVMDRGEIKERGTNAALLKRKGGLYARLYQMGGFGYGEDNAEGAKDPAAAAAGKTINVQRHTGRGKAAE